jgi:hypothetical protein
MTGCLLRRNSLPNLMPIKADAGLPGERLTFILPREIES